LSTEIPYSKPSITKLELDLVSKAALAGWGNRSNAFVSQFEDDFARRIGVQYAVATSSCTGALHLGLAASGIGKDDEVILAQSNWVATIAPIIYLGAKPVLVDIEEVSWCIDPELITSKINPKTKAIIATHLYGNLCDLNSLSRIARKNNLLLIEDSAEALGSIYEGKHAGTIGDFGVFSFHGSKTLTTGEGGMFVTNNESLAMNVRILNNHGRDPNEERQFWPSKLGYKYKMTNLQAALGIGQVSRFDELVNRKIEIFQNYQNLLFGVKDIKLNKVRINCSSGYWMPNAIFSTNSGVTREQILEEFKNNSIDARPFFWPLSNLDFIPTIEDSPVADDISKRSVNLPSFHEITDLEQSRIVKILLKLLNKNKDFLA
jgi:perosamine synthetase